MRIAIIGAGRIGKAVFSLMKFNAFNTIFDINPALVEKHDPCHLPGVQLLDDINKLDEYDIWVVATPFQENQKYIKLAAQKEKIYIDFTEDLANREFAESIAICVAIAGNEYSDKQVTYISQCGLAPGWVNIVANGLAKKFDSVESIQIRVGALPNATMADSRYAITWSPEGLINEYWNPCDAIIDGKKLKIPALERLESLNINGSEYEAFTTSGGAGSLVDEWNGKVQNLEYKTIRYVGHWEYMKKAFQVMKSTENTTKKDVTDLFKLITPTTKQDKVVVYIEVIGKRNGGKLELENFVAEFLPTEYLTAIEVSTALGAVIWLDYLQRQDHLGIMTPTILNQSDLPYEFFTRRMKAYYSGMYNKTLDI